MENAEEFEFHMRDSNIVW